MPEEFEVRGYPTLYFVSASGKLAKYEGDRSAADISNFIKNNREVISEPESGKDEL